MSLLALVTLAGCQSTPDLSSWRARSQDRSGAALLTNPTETAATIDLVREAGDLPRARQVALAAVKSFGEDAELLRRASRAETDAVLLLQAGRSLAPLPLEEQRRAAAWSALDYARRADRCAGEGTNAEVVGQLAYCMGSATHLRPMFSRAGHARETQELAQQALALDPDQLLALQTLATLELRLATLPWIADLFAWGAPEGSLERALQYAERCHAREASLEQAMLVARVRWAMQPDAAVIEFLEASLAAAGAYPRDATLALPARELITEWRAGREES